jgi:hypothetical protein
MKYQRYSSPSLGWPTIFVMTSALLAVGWSAWLIASKPKPPAPDATP